MHNRHPPLTTTTTGHDGSVRLELDKQGVGRRMREGIDDKAFPEQGAKVSIHSDGSFEGLGCVLANTNLNVLTAVFYWFTLKRDEPKSGKRSLSSRQVGANSAMMRGRPRYYSGKTALLLDLVQLGLTGDDRAAGQRRRPA